MCGSWVFSNLVTYDSYHIKFQAEPFHYFTIALNESAINPEHFGPNEGNFTVFFMYNIIIRPCDPLILFTWTHFNF